MGILKSAALADEVLRMAEPGRLVARFELVMTSKLREVVLPTRKVERRFVAASGRGKARRDGLDAALASGGLPIRRAKRGDREGARNSGQVAETPFGYGATPTSGSSCVFDAMRVSLVLQNHSGFRPLRPAARRSLRRTHLLSLLACVLLSYFRMEDFAARATAKQLRAFVESRGSGHRSPMTCSVLLDVEGGAKLTVYIGVRGTRVQSGDTRDREDGLPTCRLSLPIPAWGSVCRQERALCGPDLEALGDPRALVAFGQVLLRRTSPLQLRLSTARSAASRSRRKLHS